MQKYDIYWARFVFDDDPDKYKVRPCLILSPREGLPLGAKITKHPPREITKRSDYLIKDFTAAGLSQASTIRLSQKQRIRPLDKIGHLSKEDEIEVEKILRRKQ